MLTFSEEFDELHFWDGTSGLDSRPGWARGEWADQGFSWTGDGDTWYVQPTNLGTSPNPFSVKDGILTITASRSTTEFMDYRGTYHYTSGVVSTYHQFQQTYGYFEIRARVSVEAGTLPAFWLLPTDDSWPPELDVMEILGSDPSTLHMTVHSQTGGEMMDSPTHYRTESKLPIPDASADFHTYGIDWQADKITWYFDGKPVFQAPTPADMHKPMYMIVNLNVGGPWEGYPDATGSFAPTFMIDYIRAYDRFPGLGELLPMPTVTSVGGSDRVIGALVADHLVTGTATPGGVVRVLFGDMELGRVIAGGNGHWSYVLTSENLSLIGEWGKKPISAQVVDAYGNASLWSNPFDFTLDLSSAVLTKAEDRVELGPEGGVVRATAATLGRGDVLLGGYGEDTLILHGSTKPSVTTFTLSKATQPGGILMSDFENIDAAGLKAAVKLTGSASRNVLKGGAGNDTIKCGSGNDVIDGGSGNDTLYGGSGKDTFVFRLAPKKKNFDRIMDFAPKDDSIWLDNAVHRKIGKGTLDKPLQLDKRFFTTGEKAKDRNDYIIYNKKTGALSYDGDGSGGGKAIEIARLKAGLHLTFKDFLVI